MRRSPLPRTEPRSYSDCERLDVSDRHPCICLISDSDFDKRMLLERDDDTLMDDFAADPPDHRILMYLQRYKSSLIRMRADDSGIS